MNMFTNGKNNGLQKEHLQSYANTARVRSCAAAVAPGVCPSLEMGPCEMPLPFMDLCQHRIGSKFSDAVQLPVISTTLLHS